jgi:hypothetical protein
MPKHFVPGLSVRALCRTVFGEKVAKDVHGDRWKIAEVQGVILLQPVGGKKVLVEWSDAVRFFHARLRIEQARCCLLADFQYCVPAAGIYSHAAPGLRRRYSDPLYV